MSEQDYIRTRNLTRLRMAQEILAQMLVDGHGGNAWGVGAGELAPVFTVIDTLTDRLTTQIDVRDAAGRVSRRDA